jgi:LmbE family N-acetylglucosaminyl deacetylase
MALDALFFGAHPDDVELTSAGLAALLASHGHAVGIADLTRGEAGSRGTSEGRAREAADAAKLLGVGERMNLGLPDLGLDRSDRVQLRIVAGAIRTHRPRLVVVDVSAVWERRAAALAAHVSQLDPNATDAGGRPAAATYLTNPDFPAEVEARARSFGALIGARYGEGYRVRGPVAIHDARALIGAAAGEAL